MFVFFSFWKRVFFWYLFPFIFILLLITNVIFGWKMFRSIQKFPEKVRRANNTNNFNSLENYNQKIKHYQEASKLFIKRKEYENYIFRKDYIKIRNGNFLKISFLEFHAPQTTNKWIVNLHDFTENKYLGLGAVWFFLNEGYNIISYDARSHGDSDNKEVSFGFHEKNELLAVIKYLLINYGNKLEISFFCSGVSSLTLFSLLNERIILKKIIKNISFVFLERPVINFKTYLKNIIAIRYNFSPILAFWGTAFFMSLFLKVNLQKKLNFLLNSFVQKVTSIPFFITTEFVNQKNPLSEDTFSFLRKKETLKDKDDMIDKTLVFEEPKYGKLNYSCHSKIKQEIIAFIKKVN